MSDIRSFNHVFTFSTTAPRFDLVFILIDKPDEQLDGLLSDHIMNLHKMQRSKGQLQEAPSITSLTSAG